MTVDELMAALRRLDPAARVFVEGYESGMNDLRAVEPVDVLRDGNNDEYGGKHTYYDAHDDGDVPHCRGFLLS